MFQTENIIFYLIYHMDIIISPCDSQASCAVRVAYAPTHTRVKPLPALTGMGAAGYGYSQVTWVLFKPAQVRRRVS